jgi:hypothetical protein
MQTRSMKQQNEKRKEYEVNINFDMASNEWRKNKNSLDNGCFEYKKKVSQSSHDCHYYLRSTTKLT